jgi:hypothetical protein
MRFPRINTPLVPALRGGQATESNKSNTSINSAERKALFSKISMLTSMAISLSAIATDFYVPSRVTPWG